MMTTCSFLPLFLGCFAAPQGDGCPPALEVLSRLLQMPAEARLLVESRFEYAAPSAEALEQSLAYWRSMPRDRWISDSPADEAWIRGQLDFIQIDRPDRIPISLNAWLGTVRRQPGGSQFSRSEVCTLGWPDFRYEALELIQDGERAGEPLKRYRLRHNAELIAWSTISGERQRTDRMQGARDDSGLEGSLVRYYQLIQDINTLIAIAEGQDGISLQGPDLFLYADMRRPADLKRLDFGPIGYYELPGVVVCKVTLDSQGLALEILWHDSLGGLLSRYDVRWRTEGATFPRDLEQLYFAPGTDLVTTRFTLSSQELPWESASVETFEWRPIPGERVVDSRFGRPVSYRVTEAGTIPDDASLLVEAERMQSSLDSERLPTYSAQDQVVPAISPQGGEPPARRALRALSDAIDLGRQPVGSYHGLEFALRNQTDAAVRIGSIRMECGTAEVSPHGLVNPYRHWISAGDTRAMTFRQNVQGVGPQDRMIRIHVVEPWEEVVELHVRFEGMPALQVFPDPLDIGRVSAGQPIRATAYVVDSGCVPEGESPICEASGFSVSSGWVRDPEGGFLVGDLTLGLADRNRLGVQQTFLAVRASACPDSLGQTLLRVEIVPEGELERWPSCTIILLGGRSDETGTLALPDTQMTGFTTTPSELPSGLLCRIERHEGSDRLEVSVQRQVLHRRETYSFTIHLATSRGTVDVPVHVLPGTPGENSMQFMWDPKGARPIDPGDR